MLKLVNANLVCVLGIFQTQLDSCHSTCTHVFVIVKSAAVCISATTIVHWEFQISHNYFFCTSMISAIDFGLSGLDEG